MSSVIDYYAARLAELHADPEPLPDELRDLLLAVNALRHEDALKEEQPDPEWIAQLEADARLLRSLQTYQVLWTPLGPTE